VSSALDEAAAALTRMRSQNGKPNSAAPTPEQGRCDCSPKNHGV